MLAHPRLIGVLDLLDGVAVRAIAGRRDEYRPVRSRLCDSSDPRRIATAYRAHYGIDDLYVADLDAILSRPPNRDLVAALADDGFRVALDPGLRSVCDAESFLSLNVSTLIAGLETLTGPDTLAALVTAVGPERLAFSIDLRSGVPLADPALWEEPTWTSDSPLLLARRAADVGLRHLILLDLASVGTAAGPATIDACRAIARDLPHYRLWTGGGVRSVADVNALADAGVQGVLVASALHDRAL